MDAAADYLRSIIGEEAAEALVFISTKFITLLQGVLLILPNHHKCILLFLF